MSSSSGNMFSPTEHPSSVHHYAVDSFLKAPSPQLQNPFVDEINSIEYWMPGFTSEPEALDWYQKIDRTNLVDNYAEEFFQNPYAVAGYSDATAMGALFSLNGDNAEIIPTMGNWEPIPEFSSSTSELQSEPRKMGAHSRRKKEAKFVCSDCGNGFTTRFRLQTHVNRYHTPQELQVRYYCDKCLYSTTFSTDLPRHVKSCRVGAK